MKTTWLTAALLSLALSQIALSQNLTVTSSFDRAGFIDPTTPIALQLDRPLTAAEGKLAVLIDQSDVTELFRATPTRLEYDPTTVPLPAGPHQVTVHLVGTNGQWQEIASFPLQVLTAGGFQESSFTPQVDIGVKAVVAEEHDAGNVPPRDTYQDGILNANIASRHSRDGWTMTSQFRIAGTTYINEALRFSAEGQDAPKIDLAGYLLTVEKGVFSLNVGDVYLGGQRHLVDGFGSRGASATARFSRGDLTIAATNGTNIVGWDNFFGLSESEHRILAGTLGFELLPSRPGGLRIEASVLDGSVLPLFGFNQGVVNDAEESQGFGLRLLASDPKGRLRIDSGFSRSRSTTPLDPFLAQGEDLVAVESETRSARFANIGFDVLQNRVFGNNQYANLSFTVGHERVDPLYRSMGVPFLGADIERNVAGMAAGIGPLAFQLTHTRSEDNLDELPSILKTLTRQTSFNLVLPLSAYAVNSPRAGWLPMVSYSYDRVHQYGDSLPINGGFSDSHVPDQMSLNQSAGLAWQDGPITFAYGYNRSFQDNRQPGRENADLLNNNHTFSLGWSPTGAFNASLDYALERVKNEELARIDRLRRLGVSMSWTMSRGFSLLASYSGSNSEDDLDISKLETSDIDLQGSWRFSLRRGKDRPSGLLFVRFARQSAASSDRQFGFDDDNTSWQVSTGLTLSAF